MNLYLGHKPKILVVLMIVLYPQVRGIILDETKTDNPPGTVQSTIETPQKVKDKMQSCLVNVGFSSH